MANPFLARLLDTQQRGLQAERERQMRNQGFGNLGFLGQSVQRSFQPLAEMRQQEALQKQQQDASMARQKQQQAFEQQQLASELGIQYDPETNEFFKETPARFFQGGEIATPAGRQTVSPAQIRADIDAGKAKSIAEAQSQFSLDVLGKELDEKRRIVVENLGGVLDKKDGTLLVKIPLRDSSGQVMYDENNRPLYSNPVPVDDAILAQEQRKTKQIEETKSKVKVDQTEKISDIGDRKAAEKMGIKYDPATDEYYREVFEDGGDKVIRVPVNYEEVRIALDSQKEKSVTTARKEAEEPFETKEFDRESARRKDELKEQYGYNRQLKELSFEHEKAINKIDFKQQNVRDALNRISESDNPDEALEALFNIDGIDSGLKQAVLTQVRKNNKDKTTSQNEKKFQNNILAAQLIPDAKDKLEFLQSKGIIPEGTYVDPNSKIFVQEVLAKTVEKFDGGDTTEIVSTAKSLGLSDDQAEAFGRLAKINAGSVNRDFQQKLLYSGILSESQQFELAKRLDPSGMTGITNFAPWKESRRVVQQLIEGGNIPSDAALEQAGFDAKNFGAIKELAAKKGLNTKAKEILNGISNFLENDDVTDEQRTEYYDSINTPANKEALKSLGLSELIQFQGLSEKKLNDKQKDIDAKNLQLSKKELNEAQAFYYKNYKGNSSQVQDAVTKLWLYEAKNISTTYSNDEITKFEKLNELTEGLSEQYPGWTVPGGAGTVPSTEEQLKTGGAFNPNTGNESKGDDTPSKTEETTETKDPTTEEIVYGSIDSAMKSIPELEKQILGTPRYEGMNQEDALSDSMIRGKKELDRLIRYEKSKGSPNMRRFTNEKEAIEYFSKNPDKLGKGVPPEAGGFFTKSFSPETIDYNGLYYIINQLENAF